MEAALNFEKWKYLFLACTATICICFSISYGLNQINNSVKLINGGLRAGIDSVKGMQEHRNTEAHSYHNDITTRLDRLERKVDSLLQ